MKSFREQLQSVMQKRDKEIDPQKFKEATTPAAQTLITYIRQWNFGSRDIALGRLLECDRWTDKGTLELECGHKGKPYPLKLPLSLAYERYMYGDQTYQFFPSYRFVAGIKNIPDNLTDDWAAELKGMFFDMGRLTVDDVKLISLGKWVKSLGSNNPHAIAGWNRNVTEWQDAQKAIDNYCLGRKDWENLRSANLQDPLHKQEMSKVLSDILTNADAIVEPAFKALKEQEKRDRIRQEATFARNNVKDLKAFFQKYNIASSILDVIVNLISNTELTFS